MSQDKAEFAKDTWALAGEIGHEIAQVILRLNNQKRQGDLATASLIAMTWCLAVSEDVLRAVGEQQAWIDRLKERAKRPCDRPLSERLN